MVKIRIPASSANLGPGFDCLGLALKLYLYLEMEEIEEGLIIEGQGEGAEELDQGKDNLIWKSAELVLKKAGGDKSKKGLKIKTFNQI
ncbi:MAG: homoserine kinase, partial [Candidatus Infernicultor aquiphilus]